MRIVSVTELRKHLSYYIDLSDKEEILITRYNKIISCLVGPTIKAINYIESLDIPNNIKTNEKLLEEEILSKYNYLN